MEHILPSGSKLVITVAPFIDSKALFDAVIKAFRSTNQGNLDPNKDLMSVLEVVTSDEVGVALQKCFQRVTYEGLKFTPQLLDDPNLTEKIRNDYMTICSLVVDANVKPFLGQTFSESKTPAETPAANRQ